MTTTPGRLGRMAAGLRLPARWIIGLMVGLYLVAWFPAVWGWPVTVVSGDSMMPRLRPGDVVVTRPLDSHVPGPGDIVVFRNPSRPDHTTVHRVVEDGDRGLVTKGDNNPTPDTQPVGRADVIGSVVVRVPFVGLPMLWAQRGEWAALVVATVAIGALAMSAARRPLRSVSYRRAVAVVDEPARPFRPRRRILRRRPAEVVGVRVTRW